MTIRVLPSVLVNRIAAGEVIERPASVVKELVENAIDAGALRVDVTLEQAGKNRLVVEDDGRGMTREELALSVQRHATSKLPSDDLLDIRFLGFRGEALPSIASVSRMTVTSRTRSGDAAWAIVVEGGDAQPPQPAAMNQGTRVEVRDLFYATPARLKFLKGDRSETQHALDTITRLAMAHPHISFSLTSDGKNLLRVDASQGELLDARLKRLGDILGKEFSDNALALDRQRETVRLSGFAALPTYNRGTSGEQYLFVNGRPVRDRLLLGAVKGAYQDVLAHDRHPVVALFIDLPAQEVDVNVHPAKAEVRFRDNQQVRGLIVGGIRHALAEAGYRASTSVASDALQHFTASSGYAYAPPSGHAPVFRENFGGSYAPMPQTGSLLSQHMTPPMARTEEHPLNAPGNTDYTLYPLGAARGQVHQTYIVAETVDGLVLVDQHAAHERLTMETMKKAIEKQGVIRQKLLIPEVVTLPGDVTDAILARREELLSFGLVIEPFGENTMVVREIPAMLGDVNVAGLIGELADGIREFGETLALKERLDHWCATIACHNSVRAGRSLSIAEMNSLLRQMEQTPMSGQCNHGRPTYIELKRKDIEKLFGRKG